MGKMNAGGIFFSGGLAAVLQEPKFGTPGAMFRRFLSSGLMIGGIGLYMNSGSDK